MPPGDAPDRAARATVAIALTLVPASAAPSQCDISITPDGRVEPFRCHVSQPGGRPDCAILFDCRPSSSVRKGQRARAIGRVSGRRAANSDH
jgi:hypothetical protein